jgi:hypothetical protein
MPFVNVKLIEGVFTSEQKQRIVRDLTDATVAIEGENMRVRSPVGLARALGTGWRAHDLP